MRYLIAIPLLLALAGPLAAAPVGDGLKVNTEAEDWSPWQTRLAISAPGLSLWNGLAPTSHAAALLATDRYFNWGRLGDGGGLRATSALLLGPGALALAAPAGIGNGDMVWRGTFSSGMTDSEAATAMPYLGLGYSAWWARAGLGVSADLGVAAQRPAQAVRFGRVMSGTERLDDMIRAMQISPMLQVNLSYAF